MGWTEKYLLAIKSGVKSPVPQKEGINPARGFCHLVLTCKDPGPLHLRESKKSHFAGVGNVNRPKNDIEGKWFNDQ